MAQKRGDEAMVGLLMEFGATKDATGGDEPAKVPNPDRELKPAVASQANPMEAHGSNDLESELNDVKKQADWCVGSGVDAEPEDMDFFG